MRVLRKAAECRVAHEYIRLLARSKKASSRRENDAACSRQSRFLRGRSDGANGWCRGPESNWLRPPFQGGALPMSYPGTGDLEIVGVMRSCVNSPKNATQNQCDDSSNSFIQLRFFSTSRGFVPSGGPTIPSFSIRS